MTTGGPKTAYCTDAAVPPAPPRMTRNLLAAAFWIAAVAVLMFEGFVWMRFGRWPGYSMADALALMGAPAFARWARMPAAWLELRQALAWVPLPAALALIATALSWGAWRR